MAPPLEHLGTQRRALEGMTRRCTYLKGRILVEKRTGYSELVMELVLAPIDRAGTGVVVVVVVVVVEMQSAR